MILLVRLLHTGQARKAVARRVIEHRNKKPPDKEGVGKVIFTSNGHVEPVETYLVFKMIRISIRQLTDQCDQLFQLFTHPL